MFFKAKIFSYYCCSKEKGCFLYETEQNNSSFYLLSLLFFLPFLSPFLFWFQVLELTWFTEAYWSYSLSAPIELGLGPCGRPLSTDTKEVALEFHAFVDSLGSYCAFFFQPLSLLELLYVSGINIWLKYFENFYLHFDIFSVFLLSFFLFFYWTKERRNRVRQWYSL